MRAVLFAFADLVWAGAAHAQELMSARAFRDAGTARIQEPSPDVEIEIRDDLGSNVRVPDKEGPYIVFANWLRSRGQLASATPLRYRNGVLTDAPAPDR
jgi:hypothetical protein